MRIWAFPSFYPFDRPGMKWVGIFAHRQYQVLAASGIDVRVVQPVMWYPSAPFHRLHKDWRQSASYKYPMERIFDGVTVYHPRVANMKPGRLFRKPYAERYIESIVRFFEESHLSVNAATDIFYAQWIPDAWMVQEAAHRLGLKSAVLVIGDDVIVWPHSSEQNKAIFINTMKQADLRLSVAAYLANEANKIVGEELQFGVVRRGVNHGFFRPIEGGVQARADLKKKFGIPQDAIAILSIGSAIVRKGWLDLFDALKDVANSGRRFVVVAAHGGLPEFDLEKEAAARGLHPDQLINLGEIDPKEINLLYNAADIFCLPSHWEGIANSVVEAMSSGLAVVTTDVCGHPELVQHGVNGLLVPPKSPTALSEALQSLMSDECLRQTLGENARSFIVSTMILICCADNIPQIYEKTATEKHPS